MAQVEFNNIYLPIYYTTLSYYKFSLNYTEAVTIFKLELYVAFTLKADIP